MEAMDPGAGGINVGDGTITLKVGAEQRIISVRESILRKTSGFFDAAFKKAWKESDKRILRLPQDHGDAIYVYVQWLYASKIFVKTKVEKVSLISGL